MRLESEFSVLQSMDDNELLSPGESGSKLKNNGVHRVEDKLFDEMNLRGAEVVSPSVTVVSDEGGGSSSSLFPAVDIRQGLKKWRRIPREIGRKTGSNSSPVQQRMLNVNGGRFIQPDIGTRAGSDQNSRSSTAASDLKEVNSVTVLPDDSVRNGRVGSGKKARGVKMEKENLNSNSNSTMGELGSDSGRSGFVFVQGSNTEGSKGRQSGSPAKHDEESSDGKDLNEESQVLDSDDGNIGKHEVSMEYGPLEESIKGLYSVQEEFEREVQKWKDVGKDDPSIFNDPINEILELKDAKILELELALSSGGTKAELEDCLMKMIQVDVENVVITATTKRLTEGSSSEIKHNLQEKTVSSKGALAPDETLETKENLKKLQNRVCRFTSCFLIQFILLLVTLFLIFSPQTEEVVPT